MVVHKRSKIGERTVKALKWAEPAIDKYMFIAAADLGLFYGAAEWIDRSDYSDPTNALIIAGATAVVTSLSWAASISKTARPIREYVGRLNRKVDRNRKASWIKTGALAASIAFTGSELNPYFQQMRQDIFPRARDPPLVATAKPQVPQVTRERPKAYDDVGHTNGIKYDFTGTKLAHKSGMTGRIQRTLRWKPIYTAVEEAHGLPTGTLAGMIMQESYGDPVQPNATDDGGLGVVHIQGTTAKLYGLDIYGSSNRDSDRNHGQQIREMLQRCNYDTACAEKYDDRAHILKVLDAAARIVREGKEKHGSWDAGIEYYRAPGKVGKNLTWRYLRDVKAWREGIQDMDSRNKAAADFENRNGYSFDTYISKWHSMSNNWGLKEYAKRTDLNR